MATEEGDRTYWRAEDLGIKNEPLLVSLIRYRQKKNRQRVVGWWSEIQPNLISSKTTTGKQKPIIDLDFEFEIKPSSTPGHYHLYLNHEISNTRFVVLMAALWFSGVVEMGYAVWSIRRMGNFVRPPGVQKQPGEETTKPAYGWLFKYPEGPHDDRL